MSVGNIVISTRMANAFTFVDLRISHPMESGLRKDKQGIVIPPWYIINLEIFYKDESIASLELGPLVSRNPALSFVLNAAAEDDIVKVTWLDNRGESGERLAKIET